MYFFPKFSSFYMFLITFSTSSLLFTKIIDGSGIICIQVILYLFLYVGNKITNLGCVVFTIVTSVTICEVKIIYDILPKIFLHLSNSLLFIMSHFFLIHYGALIFLEFGADKLRKQDYNNFSDMTLIMFLSFPIIVSTIWTYVGSFYIDLSLIPFIFQFLIFVLYQALTRTSETSDTSSSMLPDRKEVPLMVCVVQFMSGIVVHVAVMIYSAWHSPIVWRQLICDHLAMWDLALLYTALLPTTRDLISITPITDDLINRGILYSGMAGYVMILPVLGMHGVHFHTSRLMFFKMLVLGSSLFLVATRPRRLMPIILAMTTALSMAFCWEMPWGIQLLPRTSFFLERIYLSIILMAVSTVVGVRYLVKFDRHGRLPSRQFELSFVVLVTVFHSAEWSLYFTNLAPVTFVVMSTLFLLIVELSIYSAGRTNILTAAAIECQLIGKLTLLLVYWSTGTRIPLPVTCVLATLVAGFIISVSLKFQSSFSLTISALKGSILFVCVVIIKEPIIMVLAYGVTGEEVLSQLTVLHCLVISLVLDLLISVKPTRKSIVTKSSLVRAILVMSASSLLMNLMLPLGIVLLGIYAVCIGAGSRWILSKMIWNSVVLAGGSVLLVGSVSDQEIWDLALMFLLIVTSHSILQLALQPSIRIFKRFFMRIWIFGIVVCVVVLFCGSKDYMRYAMVAGYHFIVAAILSRRIGCLEINLESNSTILDLRKVLSKIQIIAIVQCFAGGLLAYRLDFSTIQVVVLPLVLFLLERHNCNCQYQQLTANKINIVSLVISTTCLLFFLATIQQSPLMLPSVFNTAQDLSLQLDLSLNLQSWFELVLSSLLATCHAIMLVLSVLSVAPHDCARTSEFVNLDFWLIFYTAVIPLSLGFIFCSTGISSVALAFLSFASGARHLFL